MTNLQFSLVLGALSLENLQLSNDFYKIEMKSQGFPNFRKENDQKHWTRSATTRVVKLLTHASCG